MAGERSALPGRRGRHEDQGTAHAPSERAIRAALDHVLLANLRYVTVGLTFLFLALAVTQAFRSGEEWRAFTVQQLVLVALFASLWLALRRGAFPPRFAHPLATVITLALVADALPFMSNEARPLQSVSFILIALAVGFFYTHARWFAGTLALVLAAWAFAAVTLDYVPREFIQPFTVFMIEAAVLSVLVFVSHVRTLRRVVALRIMDARHRDDLVCERERLGSLTRELQAANQELEAFNATVSHDLRAPLRGIDYFGSMLHEEHAHELSADGVDALEHLRAETQRATQLADDLLRLSRSMRADLKRERVDVGALARAIAESLRAREPDRTVTFQIQEGLAADADPRLVRIVLDNLIGNAWKYTSKREDAVIEVGSERVGGARAFYVKDNGVGFDPQRSDKLFRAFQRLHPAREFEGTGVGLATVSNIVARHGGRVWAEGAPGEGATFWFTLSPTSSSDGPRASAARASGP